MYNIWSKSLVIKLTNKNLPVITFSDHCEGFTFFETEFVIVLSFIFEQREHFSLPDVSQFLLEKSLQIGVIVQSTENSKRKDLIC